MIKNYIINQFNFKKVFLLNLLQIFGFLHAELNANENFAVLSYEDEISNVIVSAIVFKYNLMTKDQEDVL